MQKSSRPKINIPPAHQPSKSPSISSKLTDMRHVLSDSPVMPEGNEAEKMDQDESGMHTSSSESSSRRDDTSTRRCLGITSRPASGALAALNTGMNDRDIGGRRASFQFSASAASAWTPSFRSGLSLLSTGGTPQSSSSASRNIFSSSGQKRPFEEYSRGVTLFKLEEFRRILGSPSTTGPQQKKRKMFVHSQHTTASGKLRHGIFGTSGTGAGRSAEASHLSNPEVITLDDAGDNTQGTSDEPLMNFPSDDEMLDNHPSDSEMVPANENEDGDDSHFLETVMDKKSHANDDQHDMNMDEEDQLLGGDTFEKCDDANPEEGNKLTIRVDTATDDRKVSTPQLTSSDEKKKNGEGIKEMPKTPNDTDGTNKDSITVMEQNAKSPGNNDSSIADIDNSTEQTLEIKGGNKETNNNGEPTTTNPNRTSDANRNIPQTQMTKKSSVNSSSSSRSCSGSCSGSGSSESSGSSGSSGGEEKAGEGYDSSDLEIDNNNDESDYSFDGENNLKPPPGHKYEDKAFASDGQQASSTSVGKQKSAQELSSKEFFKKKVASPKPREVQTMEYMCSIGAGGVKITSSQPLQMQNSLLQKDEQSIESVSSKSDSAQLKLTPGNPDQNPEHTQAKQSTGGSAKKTKKKSSTKQKGKEDKSDTNKAENDGEDIDETNNPPSGKDRMADAEFEWIYNGVLAFICFLSYMTPKFNYI